MKLSVSKKMGVMVAASLTVTLTIMIILLLNQEESVKKTKAQSTVNELSSAVTESIIFAMGEGVTQVKPFIDRSKRIKHVKELRVIPTNKIKEGSESSMDSEEREVMNSTKPSFHEEDFYGEPVARAIRPILADDNCINCHSANVGDPLAVISLRYSMKEDYEAISGQRLTAILMALGTIIVAFAVMMIYLKRKFIADLLICISEIKLLSTGNISGKLEIQRDDELGELSSSVKLLQSSIKQHSEAAARIAEGNVNITINRLSDQDVLGKAMMTVKDNLAALLNDVKTMSASAGEGSLSSRLNAARHCGSYSTLINGCNNTLEAMHTPIEEGSKVLAKMAEGDFTFRMTGEYKGDFARLTNSINKVADSLNEALYKITESIQATSAASSQISSSTEEMAAGAQEQSTQTREVAVSVEQMASTIMETTRNATAAAENAKKAGDIAAEGGKVVLETVDGMNRISEVVTRSAETVKKLGTSSEQIGDIIQVIDDIADQTNLLALNAAIEAARAGEQGRGFAVVADEVRKLAERTTKATKEIAAMIKQIQRDTVEAVESMNRGTQQVEEGKKLAGKAGESLNQIITASKKVLDDVTQVAAASEQQSSSAEEISRSIDAITNVSNETSAGIQQIAKAAEDLNNLTDNLQLLFNHFKISSSDMRSSEKSGSCIRTDGKLIEL